MTCEQAALLRGAEPMIQSRGLPPERHADRLVAEMMRHLAVTRARLSQQIAEAILSSSDGSPKAQRKMLARIQKVGAVGAFLKPGKRGQYSLGFFDWTGWDRTRNEEIKLDDSLPPKPQIVCWLNRIKSEGRGRNKTNFQPVPFLFITHHALSRAAQRLGIRTIDDLSTVIMGLSGTAMDLLLENFHDSEWWAKVPPMGLRVPLADNSSIVVVLKKHPARKAFLAATILIENEHQTAGEEALE
jgi:hypothetical protein